MKNLRMYKENRKSINAHVGCEHNCLYCKPSFQRLLLRRKCDLCRTFTPHFHPTRLDKAPPRTKGKEFIFFPSMGDPCFAKHKDFLKMLEYTKKYSDRTFLIQTKDPAFFQCYNFSDNIILGITLETNLRVFHTPSFFKTYERISKAPIPVFRFGDFRRVTHRHKIVTIEPILKHDKKIMIAWIYQINPEIVYVGYDNHKCKLPEPKLSETKELIKELRRFTEVRDKSLRKAWYE